MNNSRYAQDVRDRLPEPGTPMANLRHTVAAFGAIDEDTLVVTATSGVYEQPTGLTWGDLRTLLDYLEQVEEHLRPDHPAFR